MTVYLFIVVLIESQAEQVCGIFWGAVRLSASPVLYVFKIKGRTVSITRGGPNQLRGSSRVAQNRLQFPNLGQNTHSVLDAQRSQLFLIKSFQLIDSDQMEKSQLF